MDKLDRDIINCLQSDFPVSDRPFVELGDQFNTSESEVMERIRFMLDDGLLTRFGPLFNIDKMGGVFTLCAMQVPDNQFDTIAAKVNVLPEVAHNYERDHRLNMWFVIAAQSQQALKKTIKQIENTTGLDVFNFPKLEEFYVNLQLRA